MHADLNQARGPSRLIWAVALGALLAACFVAPHVASRESTLFAAVIGVCGLLCLTTHGMGVWTGANIGGAVGLIAAVALSGGSTTPVQNQLVFLLVGSVLCAVLGYLSGGLDSTFLAPHTRRNAGAAAASPLLSAGEVTARVEMPLTLLLDEFETWCAALEQQQMMLQTVASVELERFLAEALPRLCGATDVRVRMLAHDSAAEMAGLGDYGAWSFALHDAGDPAAVAHVLVRGAAHACEPALLRAVVQLMWSRLVQVVRHRQAAAADAVTGVLTRAAFVRVIGELAQRAQAELGQVTLAVFEISDARESAEVAAWEALDVRMRAAAQLVRTRARKNDVVGRIDEVRLALALPRADAALARRIADKLAGEVSARLRDEGGGGIVRVGVAECPGIAGERASAAVVAALASAAQSAQAVQAGVTAESPTACRAVAPIAVGTAGIVGGAA